MHTPPFQLAGVSGAMRPADRLQHRHPLAGDACCAPAASAEAAAARRLRLADLDRHMHCSIIGTCLTTTALRTLIARLTDIDARSATDLEIHHAAVDLAGKPGPVVKALHKALDDKHALAIKRFGAADDPARLAELWRDALDAGDVPGAYWALLTHAHATHDLRKRAFGDVHMLSHLVGAANRADLRRLAALEQQQAELKALVERQQERLQQMSGECDLAQRRRAELEVELHTLRAAPRAAMDDELHTLREALDDRDRVVAVHTARREVAERDTLVAREEAAMRSAELQRARHTIEALLHEVAALECQVANDGDDASAPEALLQGRRIIYVGGRPSTSSTIRTLVERAGGTIVTHDGGVEQRKGQFAASLPGADLVVFPVDCVDHDSVATLKRLCERHGVTYRALRSASVASFVAAIAELAPNGAAANATAARAGSRPCLRHG